MNYWAQILLDLVANIVYNKLPDNIIRVVWDNVSRSLKINVTDAEIVVGDW